LYAGERLKCVDQLNPHCFSDLDRKIMNGHFAAEADSPFLTPLSAFD
jgi:hypothetical protein